MMTKVFSMLATHDNRSFCLLFLRHPIQSVKMMMMHLLMVLTLLLTVLTLQ